MSNKIYYHNGVDKVVRFDGSTDKSQPKVTMITEHKGLAFKPGPGIYDITTKDGTVINLDPDGAAPSEVVGEKPEL